MRIGVRQSLLRDRCWMLDIQECSNSEVQKHPVLQRRINIQEPVLQRRINIQNQPILAMIFVLTAYIEYIILCNYRVKRVCYEVCK